MKHTPLKRTPINRYSLKKIAELQGEFEIRLRLIARCHGTPMVHKETIYRNGGKYVIPKADCIGGICECGCGRTAREPDRLHPHERTSRSHCGKLSMENSLMVLNECHEKLQGNQVKLRWLK